MNTKYKKCINEWNNIFLKEISKTVNKISSGNEELDQSIQWLTKDSKRVLDFGCGNGTMLFLCALNGTEYNLGIDLSEVGIENAKKAAKNMITGEFKFIKGSIRSLKKIQSSSFDGVVLSNILDNLYPEDVDILMNQIWRILKENGKVLVKLNPFVTAKEIRDWKIKVIKDNLLNDGLLLLNNTTDEWKDLFKQLFIIECYEEIYYPEYDHYSRVFHLIKKGDKH